MKNRVPRLGPGFAIALCLSGCSPARPSPQPVARPPAAQPLEPVTIAAILRLRAPTTFRPPAELLNQGSLDPSGRPLWKMDILSGWRPPIPDHVFSSLGDNDTLATLGFGAGVVWAREPGAMDWRRIVDVPWDGRTTVVGRTIRVCDTQPPVERFSGLGIDVVRDAKWTGLEPASCETASRHNFDDDNFLIDPIEKWPSGWKLQVPYLTAECRWVGMETKVCDPGKLLSHYLRDEKGIRIVPGINSALRFGPVVVDPEGRQFDFSMEADGSWQRAYPTPAPTGRYIAYDAAGAKMSAVDSRIVAGIPALLDVETGERRTLGDPLPYGPYALEWFDGDKFVGVDGRFYDSRSGELVGGLKFKKGAPFSVDLDEKDTPIRVEPRWRPGDEPLERLYGEPNTMAGVLPGEATAGTELPLDGKPYRIGGAEPGLWALWDATTGANLFAAIGVVSVSYSPQKRWVAIGLNRCELDPISQGSVVIVDVATGHVVNTLGLYYLSEYTKLRWLSSVGPDILAVLDRDARFLRPDDGEILHASPANGEGLVYWTESAVTDGDAKELESWEFRPEGRLDKLIRGDKLRHPNLWSDFRAGRPLVHPDLEQD